MWSQRVRQSLKTICRPRSYNRFDPLNRFRLRGPFPLPLRLPQRATWLRGYPLLRILPCPLPARPLPALTPHWLLTVDPAITGDISPLVLQLFRWARLQGGIKVLPAVERELVIEALKETQGNQVQAAKLLGITRATLRKRVDKFGIRRELNVS